ncbi:unnamed protein product [Urochloa decumbens]|uniref:F-box domain-containing protein n=1 Tax=Urochloa decumbens TaxID=240449 RepID=A0ABC8YIA7_9POAL
MAKRSKKKKRNNPAASLTDDLIVEILSRLPVKSLCRFKCVSRHWRALISHPEHRKKLPQTLAGVFYRSRDNTRFPQVTRHFSNVWEIGMRTLVRPSLSFFPRYESISLILDSCNGLLLCRLRSVTEISSSSHIASFRYLVCNPATKSWVVLPNSGCGSNLRITRLGFDPAVSLRFHVFEFIENEGEDVVGVQIYSSKTGTWSYKESEWDSETSLFYDGTRSVFLNGLLHLVVVHSGVVAVDVEGKTWWKLTVPDYRIDGDGWQPGFLGQYQGQLCYINECDYENDLSIWVLQDYATDDWILKHHVSIQRLCEKVMNPYRSRFYHVITVHPDSNLILYIAGQENTLMAYHVGREEAWVIKNLGSKCQPQYIPYTLFYTESLTNTHS